MIQKHLIYKPSKIITKCDYCKEIIYLYPSEIKRNYHHFCNSRCMYAYQSGKNNPVQGHRSEVVKEKISKTKKERYIKEKHPMYGKKHTKEAKLKMRKAKLELIAKGLFNPIPPSHFEKGEKHYNWKGGISLENFEKLYGMNMDKWEKLTIKIRKRDNYICQYCGEKNATHVHHIFPKRIKIDNHPDNLITLCNKCHPKVEHLTNIYIEQNRNPIEIFYEKWSK